MMKRAFFAWTITGSLLAVAACSHSSVKQETPTATPPEVSSEAGAAREPATSREAVLLGATSLTRELRDSDMIEVAGRCPGSYRIHAVQIRVLDQPVEIESVVLEFGNGQKLPLDARSMRYRDRYRSGERSELIDLPGGARCVERIYVRGRTEGGFDNRRPAPARRRGDNRRPVEPPRRGEGVVEIWGIRLDEAPQSVPVQEIVGVVPLANDYVFNSNPSWYSVNLGSCRDRNNAPVTELRLKILKDDCRLNKLYINYGEGRWEHIYLGDEKVREHQQNSRPILIPAAPRCVEAIAVMGSPVRAFRSVDVEITATRIRTPGGHYPPGGGHGPGPRPDPRPDPWPEPRPEPRPDPRPDPGYPPHYPPGAPINQVSLFRSDSCSSDALGDLTPRTDCSTFRGTRAYGLRVNNTCHDIVDMDADAACEQFRSLTVRPEQELIFSYFDDSCSSGLNAVFDSATGCHQGVGQGRTYAVKHRNRCYDVRDSSIVEACQRMQGLASEYPSGLVYFYQNDSCRSELLAVVDPYRGGCEAAGRISDRVYAVSRNGSCSDIEDTQFDYACARFGR